MRIVAGIVGGLVLGLAAFQAGSEPEEHARSPHWPKVRAEHLKRCPTCAACGGKDNLQVHHVQPFHLHPDLELDDANLITLCEKPGHCCHFVFGHNYNWKTWNPHVREDAARQLRRVKARQSRRKLSWIDCGAAA